jgi:hypothetical protein
VTTRNTDVFDKVIYIFMIKNIELISSYIIFKESKHSDGSLVGKVVLKCSGTASCDFFIEGLFVVYRGGGSQVVYNRLSSLTLPTVARSVVTAVQPSASHVFCASAGVSAANWTAAVRSSFSAGVTSSRCSR